MKFRLFFFLFLLAAGLAGADLPISGKGGGIMSAEHSAWLDTVHAKIPEPEPEDLAPKEASPAEILAALFPENEALLEESAA